LTSYLSWSWIFFVNVPVGIVAAAVAPLLLRDSRADLGHSHFDLRGAATVTSGLMLLVYALTRATSDGWTSTLTLSALTGSAALLVAFVVLEARSPWPLLPLRLFRQRTLSTANAAMAIIGAVAFSEFFLLTLYLQDVVVSNAAQAVVGRIGIRATLTAGLMISAVSVGLLTRLPVHGSYFWVLFP